LKNNKYIASALRKMQKHVNVEQNSKTYLPVFIKPTSRHLYALGSASESVGTSDRAIKCIATIMARNLKQINAYPEFRTANGIDGVRTAVLAGNPPPGTLNQQARFTAKYLNPSWVVTNIALPVPLQNHGVGRLRYRPAVGINLLVVYPDEKQACMALVYNDNRRGLGVGLQAFDSQVAMSYLNIKKTETDAFLRGQGDYQIAKIPH